MGCIHLSKQTVEAKLAAAALASDAADATHTPYEDTIDNKETMYGRQMSKIRSLITDEEFKQYYEDNETPIRNVCLIVVVDAEIRPIMEKYKFEKNEELTEQFLNLGIVSSGDVKNLHIDIIKVAESKVFKRHYSGYTQASALAALVSHIIKPDIVISFGTAGGITLVSKSQYGLGSDDFTTDENKEMTCVNHVEIGDVIFGEACLFLDRLRTRTKNAFDWGLWGGASIKTNNLCNDLGLIKGIIGSQIGYMVSSFQAELIGNANIIALDMECAPIAQILNQTGIDFIVLKVISNGIYPGSPQTMESEYNENKEMVSKKATEILVKVIDYLNDKQINEL